jgi:hypothetical protein
MINDDVLAWLKKNCRLDTGAGENNLQFHNVWPNVAKKTIKNATETVKIHGRVLQEFQNDNSALAKKKIEASAKKVEQANWKSFLA